MAKKRKSKSAKSKGVSLAEGSSSAGPPASKSRKLKHGASNRASKRGASGGKGDVLWALVLSLMAFVHRWLFLHSNRDQEWPFSIFYEGDSEAYFRFSRAVLAGKTYDEGLPFHPPGFAYVLAQVHDWLGAGAATATVPHLQVKIVLAGFSSLSVGLLYLLIRPFLGRNVAILSSLFAAYHFGLYVLAVAPVTEGVYLTLYLGAWLIFSRYLRSAVSAPDSEPSDGVLATVTLGILCGVLALIRAESMLLPFIFVVLCVLGWWLSRGRAGGSVPLSLACRPWILLLMTFGLTILPWTVRNYRALTELNRTYGERLAEPIPTFVPITIYGPLNLALANNALADGTFSRDLMSSQKLQGNLDLEDPQHLDYILHGDRHARRWITENPSDFVSLVGKKWELVSRTLTLGWTQWNWPGGLDGLRRPVDVFTPESTVLRPFLGIYLVIGALLCAASGPKARRWLGLVLAASTIGFISTTMFYGYVRQGLLMLPVLLSFAGITTAAMLSRGLAPIRERQAPGRRLLVGIGLVALGMLMLEASGRESNRNFEATGSTIPGSHKLNRDQPITLKLLPPSVEPAPP